MEDLSFQIRRVSQVRECETREHQIISLILEKIQIIESQ